MSSELNYKKYFEGKKITKQGFGYLGRGIGVTKFLLHAGATVMVTDTKPEAEFKNNIAEVKAFMEEHRIPETRITYRLGSHEFKDFEDADFIIQASGVPKNNEYLAHAKSKGVPVYQEGSLFCDIVRDYNKDLPAEHKIKTVGITGTRGKTTTTFLVHEVLKNFYKENTVHLGGNVQGVSTLEILTKIKPGDIVVLELDSWVLQGFKDIKYSPNIAIFTNLMSDHMNYYHGDMGEYFYDKAQIFLYQNNDDFLVMSDNALFAANTYLNALDNQIFSNRENVTVIDQEKTTTTVERLDIKLIGQHNKINIALAIEAAKAMSVSFESIKKTIESFTGVPGRLELRLKKRGVNYYNDTCATTGEAAMAAVKAVSEIGPIVLITGGRDKELDMSTYALFLKESIKTNVLKKIILLKDATTTGTDILINHFSKIGFDDYFLEENLEKALIAAQKFVVVGDSILFSPGFASFGMFKNEYDRGDKFNEYLEKLT